MSLGVKLPDRARRTEAIERLSALDQAGKNQGEPTSLDLAEIEEEPVLFQPRYGSIAFAPGRSEAHIQQLAKVLRQGEALDPIPVVSFGDKWFLIDGHHRLAAYRHVEWPKPVPVRVLSSTLTGRDRVDWAVQTGFDENRKDKLSINDADRSDHAWRLVAEGAGSKQEQAAASGRGVSLIGSMRRTASALRALGVDEEEMTGWPWKRAAWELRRRQAGEDDEVMSDFDERRMRHLARNLLPVLRSRPSAGELLGALEAARPGILFELEEAIRIEKEEREWKTRGDRLEI